MSGHLVQAGGQVLHRELQLLEPLLVPPLLLHRVLQPEVLLLHLRHGVTQHRALLSAAQYPHELLLGPPQLLRPPREVVLALVRPRPRHRRPRPGLGARTQALLQLLRKLGPEKSYVKVTLTNIGLKPDKVLI